MSHAESNMIFLQKCHCNCWQCWILQRNYELLCKIWIDIGSCWLNRTQGSSEQDRPCTYNVMLRHIHVTIVAMEKQ